MSEELDAERKERLVQLLDQLATNEWDTDSPLECVKFIRSNKSIPRILVVYEPSIVIVAQGCKVCYLGDEAYTYNPLNYLVLSVPLPIECETFASPEEPFLGVTISVDVNALSELLLEMDDSSASSSSVPRGIYSTPLTDELISSTIRLLECLNNPLDGRILGPAIVKEIIYRVLRGEQGGALRALAARNSSFSHIAKVLKIIHSQYDAKFDIETLANDANMSAPSFHKHFKAVTASSPLQYLKSIRLHNARILMVQDGINASTAATKVGYESSSQFNREFKRYFGSSPAEEAAKIRTILDSP